MKRTYVFSRIIFVVCILLLVSCQPTSSKVFYTPSVITPEHKEFSKLTIDEPIQEDELGESTSDEISLDLEIEFWYPWAGETAEMIEELVEKFNQENPWSITVNDISHADQDVLIEDLTEAFINGEQIPDLIVSTSQSLQTWYAEGYPIKEMDPFIRSDSENFAEETYPGILPVFWNVDMVDGKRIGIPAYQSGQFLFYNQTWGNELGFEDYPRTIEEFTEQACTAAKSNLYDSTIENNGTGGWMYSNKSLSLLSWLKVFGGGELINSRLQPILAEPENIDALTFLYDLYANGCAWKGKDPQPYLYFSNRFALFYSGQMEDIIRQIKSNKAYGNFDNWVLIPYPSTIRKPTVMVAGLSYSITAESEERALAAWKFINWMLASKNQVVLIEKTGVFPLSNEVIEQVDSETEIYTIWKDSLQYLPYAQTEPSFKEWYIIKKVLEDMAWKLTQYTMQPENIPTLLTDAEVIVREFGSENRKENSN
ncbi:MAG: extracellular solute-binding protein [Anaerolineaceae bacterium]|nr:extracellular solute-binding protein [Anaerolineaceae bacterium]